MLELTSIIGLLTLIAAIALPIGSLIAWAELGNRLGCILFICSCAFSAGRFYIGLQDRELLNSTGVPSYVVDLKAGKAHFTHDGVTLSTSDYLLVNNPSNVVVRRVIRIDGIKYCGFASNRTYLEILPKIEE